IDTNQSFGIFAWAIDIHGPLIGIDQPAESDTVIDPLLHLGLYLAEPVAGRCQLHHKIRTKVHESSLLLLSELIQTALEYPGSIGPTTCSVGEEKFGVGIARTGTGCALRPGTELHG